jgi:hypothetical protein
MAKDDNTVLNAQVQYPMSDDGRSALERFAKRDGRAITSGDMKAFGNLNASDAMEALSTGQYQGLEGIDFGTSYGRPVAKLPNGAVIQVSSGEMIAAIRKREETRRKYAAQAVDQINRDAYREENRQIFQDLIQNAQFSGYLGEGTAEFYANNYEERPMQTLAYLASLDLTDRRAQRQAEREALKTARADRKSFMLGALRQEANKLSLEQQRRKDAQGNTLDAAGMAASSDGAVAVSIMEQLVDISPDFQTPENVDAVSGVALRLLTRDERANKIITDLQREVGEAGGALPVDDGRVGYLLTRIKAALSGIGTGVSDEYAEQITNRILSAEGGVQTATILRQRGELASSLTSGEITARANSMGLSSVQGAIERFDENNNEKLDADEAFGAGASLARDVFGANGRNDLLKFGNDDYGLMTELFKMGAQGDQLADAVIKHLTDRALLPSAERDASGRPVPIDRQAIYARLRRGESIRSEDPDDVAGGSPDDQPTSTRQRGAVR